MKPTNGDGIPLNFGKKGNAIVTMHSRKPRKSRQTRPLTELDIVPAPSTSGSETNLLWDYAPGDVGNGQRFIAMHGEDVLCDDRRAKSPVWFVWDGRRWKETSEGVIREMAHQVGIAYMHQATDYRSDDPDQERAVRKQALYYLTSAGINNALSEARPYLLAHIEDFDSNHSLLNFTNGTLEVETGERHAHRREDRITRLIDFDYDSDALCPEFERFMLVTMGGNPDSDDDDPEQRIAKEMVDYLQRILGCSVTSDISEKNIYICNGPTDAGKTTTLQIVRDTIPEYSVTIPIEVLMTKERNSAVEEALFSLRGKRFAITSETGRYYTLNVARIKQITQGEDGAISVIPKYKPQVTFTATHHLFMDCNFRPRIRGGDEATWNRLRIVNFPHQLPREQQNKHLKRELLATERPGIMAWLVKGYRKYKDEGLPTVAEMEKHLNAWRSECQRLRYFLETHCWLEVEWPAKDADGNPVEYQDADENAIKPPKQWAVAQAGLWKLYSDWVAIQPNEKRMKKAEFYGDIACLPGVKQGNPTINNKQIDGFFGLALKTGN
jgi:putative DNA primase/helicase